MTDLRISVVIPAYRVTRYIRQAVDSVFAQTHPAAEVIVVNDGCPETEGLERALAPVMDRIKYIRRTNGGPGAARNTGIRAASGDLIALLDADDYYAPEFLEAQYRYLLENPDIDLAYTDALCVTDDGIAGARLMELTPSSGAATLTALLRGDCTVATTTVVARKARLELAGLFDEEIGNYSEDFDLWLRVAHTGGRIGYQRQALVFHRVHEESLTARPLQLPRGALRVLAKAREQMALSAAEREALENRFALIKADVHAAEAKQKLLAGDFPGARAAMRAAAAARPSVKRSLAAILLAVAPRLARQQVLRTER